MSQAELPNVTILVKLNNSPPSLRILEYIDDRLDRLMTFCRIHILPFTNDDLENPKILYNLEDNRVNALPALIMRQQNIVIYGAESMIEFLRPQNFVVKKPKNVEPMRDNDRSEDELLDKWRSKLMDTTDQEEMEEDKNKKTMAAKQVEDLRDDRLSKLVNKARNLMPNTKAPNTLDRVNDARGKVSRKTLGPSRDRDTIPSNDMEEVAQNNFYGGSYDSEQERKKQKLRSMIQHEEEEERLPTSHKPPGRSTADVIRNKALKGASENRAKRSDNLDIFLDDDDAVDKMLKSISKNKG